MSIGRGEPCHVVVRETDGSSLQLQARYAPAERGVAVIAPPHPLYGGSFDNPVVQQLRSAFARAKVATLAFNWRGVEESTGRASDDLTCAVADYEATLAHALTLVPQPAALVCAGYSFGAGTALLAARDDARVSLLVLVAPPVGMLLADDLRAFRGRLLVVTGDDDELSPVADLQAVLAARPDATLELIRGADHFFHFGGLGEIASRITPHLVSVFGEP